MTLPPELQELIEAARALRAYWAPEKYVLSGAPKRVIKAIDAYDAANKPPLHEQVKALLPEGWRVNAHGGDWCSIGRDNSRTVLYFYDDSPLTAYEIVDMALKLAERLEKNDQ